MAITSRIRPEGEDSELLIEAWMEAALLKPSVIKPVFTTVKKRLVLKKLGHLEKGDKEKVAQLIQKLIGPAPSK